MKATQDSVNHGFNVGLAKKYGVNEAIILSDIIYWIQHNKDENFNLFDDRTWTYRTYNGFQKHFPYWSRRQIEHLLKKLIKAKVLLSRKCTGSEQNLGCYYALVEEVLYIYEPQPKEGVAQKCATPTQNCATPLLYKYNKQNNKKSSFLKKGEKPKKENKKNQPLEPVMSVNIKSHMVNECKYIEPGASIADHSKYCHWEAGKSLLLQDSSGKPIKFELCDKHYREWNSQKKISYCNNIYTNADDRIKFIEGQNV